MDQMAREAQKQGADAAQLTESATDPLRSGQHRRSAVAGGKDFTVRVPYAFGVICSATAAAATATLMPVDSAMFLRASQ